MYYSGDILSLYSRNTAIIGKRESGKTTILKEIIHQAISEGYTIIVFDSVTDHPTKSILIDTSCNYEDIILISSPPKDDINFSKIEETNYPYSLLCNNIPSIILFDVSKYLEEGYDTDDLVERSRIREYYKRLVIQELFVLLPFMLSQKCIVIMDEIEFIPESRAIISKYMNNGISFVCALHEEASLSTSKDLFSLLKL